LNSLKIDCFATKIKLFHNLRSCLISKLIIFEKLSWESVNHRKNLYILHIFRLAMVQLHLVDCLFNYCLLFGAADFRVFIFYPWKLRVFISFQSLGLVAWIRYHHTWIFNGWVLSLWVLNLLHRLHRDNWRYQLGTW